MVTLNVNLRTFVTLFCLLSGGDGSFIALAQTIPGPAYYPNGVNGPAIPIPPLYAAVGAGNFSRVKLLLESGADPNVVIPTGWAPIHQAIYENIEILRLLLEHGANPNLAVAPISGYSNKWTPLFFAVSLRKAESVAELLKYGADWNRIDANGESIAQLALDTKDQRIIELIRQAATRRGR